MLERLADLIRDRVFWKPRIAEEVRPAGAFEGGGFTVVSDMMSLVGCSGEEFEEILVSLGFKAQKKQIAKPAVTAMQIVTEPAPEADIIVAAETEIVAPEMIDINVWWPKDTGPFRKMPERAARPEFKKRENADAKPKFNRREKQIPREKPEPRAARPEKPLDPNSPFAALAALKAQMKQG
jgi:ATP-dependent RNA helicase SUPV3L1/SUV3